MDHSTGPHHPERADRIRAVHRAVRAAGMIASPDPFPNFSMDLGAVDGRGVKLLELTPAHADLKWVRSVHTDRHLHAVHHTCEMGGGVLDQGDTPVGPDSCDVALLALGSLLTCCDAVMEGKVQRAFSAARPPGHHAEPDRPMGFCLFSNVAIAARYLRLKHGVARVGIVDFDVHHGNGTQACLEDDPHKLFISLHQHPRTCYPGSGYEWETGVGPGAGLTINLPFPPGTEDDAYLSAMRATVIPALDAFRPEVLLISAGFDAHREDPLAQTNLSEECFERMTRMLVEVANRHARGRVISALEGGYHLRALGRSVVRHLVGLAEA
ncbi:MAG TPA: histone deacetylase [Pilimelia sp.]|nr:histone deacetylase [Pilimelia sp.]